MRQHQQYKAYTWVRRPEPMPGESLTSYLDRWAKDNLLGSRNAMLNSFELSSAVRLPPGTLAPLAQALGVDLSTLEAMAPSNEPKKAVLRRSFIRPKHEAVCPQCLETASYSRQLWAHGLATACPEHGTRLLERCQQCGQGIRNDRPLPHLCECGADLRRQRTESATAAEIDFASMLQGDRPKGTIFPFFLDGEVPSDVDLYIFGLANHIALAEDGQPVAKAGKLPQPRSMTQALERLLPVYALFEDWPKKFDARIKLLIERSPAAASTGVAGRYGRWYRFLLRNHRHDAYHPIRVAVANCITLLHDGLLNARSQSVQNIATVEKQWFSVKEAATELRVTAERIQQGIDDCLIAASVNDEAMGGRQRFISRATLDQLKQAQYEHVSDTYARDLLGVHQAVYSLMCEAGWITRATPGDVPPVVSGYVKHLPLLDLINRLRESAIANKDRRDVASIPLRELNYRRTTNYQRLLALFRAVAAGELKPMDYEEGLSIGGLRFAQDEVDQRIASWFVERGLTAQQVSALTGAHYDAVKGWIDSGLLLATQEPLEQGAPWVVDIRDLITFLQTYAPLAWQARLCESTSRGLAGRLERAGISPLGSEQSGRGALVRISDLLGALRTDQAFAG